VCARCFVAVTYVAVVVSVIFVVFVVVVVAVAVITAVDVVMSKLHVVTKRWDDRREGSDRLEHLCDFERVEVLTFFFGVTRFFHFGILRPQKPLLEDWSNTDFNHDE